MSSSSPSIFVLLLLIVTLTVVSSSSASAIPVVKRVIAYDAHHYLHMTMIQKINSTFFVMAFQSSPIGEGSITQKIYMIRSYDGGNTWSNPPQMIVEHDFAVWGPAFIFVPDQQRLLLFYSQSVPQNVRSDRDYPSNYPGGDICVIESLDFGETWSSKRILLPYDDTPKITRHNFYFNVSKMTANTGPFLSLDKRSWAIPFWCEPHYPGNKNDTGIQQAGLIVTNDGGMSYEAFDHTVWNNASTAPSWLIENWVVPTSPLTPTAAATASDHQAPPFAVSLEQGYRTQLGVLVAATAPNGYDGGSAFTNPTMMTDIPNPDSKTSATALWANGDSKIEKGQTPSAFVLACNPTTNSRRVLALYHGELNNNNNNNFIDFGSSPFVILENSTVYDSDYPTILQGVENNDRQVFVSYSCFSHTAACFSIVNF